MISTKSYIKTNWVKRLLCCLLALLAFALAGCATPDGAQEEAPIVLPTPTPEPQPVSGGELRLPLSRNADITNPYTVNTEELLSLFSLVFEGLLRIDNSGKLTAALAETWSCDETGKNWTFNLRSTAHWHGGSVRVSANDVKASFDKLAAVTEESGSYYSLAVQRVESITAQDDSTVVITMKQAGLASLYSLTFPIMRAGETGALPVGTGPYMFSTATSGRVSLVANPEWWKQTPYIESILFLARDSNETALASYEAGQLNMVPTSSVSAGKYRVEGVTGVLDIMTQTVELMLVNANSSRLNDVRVRQAIACALDRSTLISNVYMNRAQACDVPVAPDNWAYDSKSKLYDYDTVRASALLQEAGWMDVDGDGLLEQGGAGGSYQDFTLTLLVNSSTDTTRMEAAGMIASQLGEIGITVNVVSAPYVLGDSESEYLAQLSSMEYDLALIGFNLSRDGDLTWLVGASGAAAYGGFSGAELEPLAREIISARDESAYQAAASALQMKLVEQLPFITLYFRLNSIVYSLDVQGISDMREPDIFLNIAKWYTDTKMDMIAYGNEDAE